MKEGQDLRLPMVRRTRLSGQMGRYAPRHG